MDVFLPKGTRDLLPEQMHNRLHVIGLLREVFTRFGFEPLETPAFERIETLTGKYGEEGDKLIYRILERGEGGREGKADLALRYDLTVPLARVMAMHPELKLPFRRYQMQPVWRADRPQKGRFREFWQCDVDIVGTTSPLADAECLAVVGDALTTLGFRDYTIRVNDRRLLASLARLTGASDEKREMSVLIALDKLDKIGRDGVDGELASRGFATDGIAALWGALDRGRDDGDPHAALDRIADGLDDAARDGVATLHRVIDAALGLGVDARRLRFDPTLARGLDYYTGPVFETEVTEPKIGSISGGGRYDRLVGMFAGRPLPAVGVSLGLERVITVMEELGMLPGQPTAARVLVAVWGPDTQAASLRAAHALRAAGVPVELYVDDAKLGKQLKYASQKGHRFALVIGPDEAARGDVGVKDLASGEQVVVPLAEAVARVRGAT